MQEAARGFDQHCFRPEGDRARCGNCSARHRRAGGTYLEVLWPGGVLFGLLAVDRNLSQVYWTLQLDRAEWRGLKFVM